jgi:signal transduction histidine kinase
VVAEVAETLCAARAERPDIEGSELFQRLHTRDEFEGTGIGLAIAKKLVEHHGGTTRASSLDEGGTRFEFTLPCDDGRS